MYATRGTKFSEFKTLRIILLVLRGGIVATLAGRANQRYHNTILFAFTCHDFLRSSSRLGLPFIDGYHVSS
jgi:hypothetical protein